MVYLVDMSHFLFFGLRSRNVPTKASVAGVSFCAVVSAGVCLALETMTVQCLYSLLAGQ